MRSPCISTPLGHHRHAGVASPDPDRNMAKSGVTIALDGLDGALDYWVRPIDDSVWYESAGGSSGARRQAAARVPGRGRAMHDYDVFRVESKAEVLEKSREFWNPGKTDFWADSGIDLVIDRRDGYFIWYMSGLRLIDVHLNGGTFNLGHRNPELVEAITTGMRSFDIGNHHFPSSARVALAEALIATAPPNLSKVVYGSGGGEAIDIALKTARHATKRR